MATICFSESTSPLKCQLIGYESDSSTDSKNPFSKLDIEDRPQEVEKGITSLAIEGLDSPIQLTQDLSGGCGGKIWEAATVMIDYLTLPSQRHLFDKKTVVELGSGTGLVGLAVARACPNLVKLVLTDQIPMLSLMQQNILLNGLQTKVDAQILNWGEPVPVSVPQCPDIILASDCVYLEVAFQPLIDTLSLLANKDTCIYMSYRKRRNADKRFFQLARKKFFLFDVKDDPKQQLYSREGLKMYLLKKK